MLSVIAVIFLAVVITWITVDHFSTYSDVYNKNLNELFGAISLILVVGGILTLLFFAVASSGFRVEATETKTVNGTLYYCENQQEEFDASWFYPGWTFMDYSDNPDTQKCYEVKK